MGSSRFFPGSGNLGSLWAYFHWSDAHTSSFINTATTIVTFWLGFLILSAQYRGDKALSVKLMS
jgi:low affinity Fe/Cu permease